MQEYDPLKIFAGTFTVTSFAGLAALLRSGRRLTVRAILSAMLNSGLLGLGIAFLWYNYFSENVWFLVGICLLAGLGGMTIVDFILAVLRFGGVQLTVNVSPDAEGTHHGDSSEK